MYSSVVEGVAYWTLAAEGAVCVDTVSVVTDAWVLHTLIQVYACVSSPRDYAMAEGTQVLERHILLLGTKFTGVSPALFGHSAAATLGLAGVEGLRHRTLAVLKAGEAVTLSGVVTPATVLRQYEARPAHTLETARVVEAGAKQADVRVFFTLVDVYTLLVLDYVARGTETTEGAVQVLAGSRSACPGEDHTLVHIHTILGIGGSLVALLTQTLEGAHTVDTLAFPAQRAKGCLTLVNIHAVIVV